MKRPKFESRSVIHSLFRPSKKLAVAASAFCTIGLVLVYEMEAGDLVDHLKSHFAARPTLPYAKLMVPVPMAVVKPMPIGNDSTASRVALRLLLTGTEVGRNAHEGRAFIGVNAQSPQTYVAGALLGNGARIQEIARDYVVLERGGKTEKLYVGGKEPPGYQAVVASMLTVGGDNPTVVTTPDNHDRLADYVRASGTFDGSTFNGLTVYPSSSSDAFYRLGLQDGDVITAVDGAPLKDQKSALDALRPLVAGRAILATVKRGDSTQILSLDGSTLL